MFSLTTAHGTVLSYDRKAGGVTDLPLADVDPTDLILLRDLGRPQIGLIDTDGTWRAIDLSSAGERRSWFPRPPQVMTIGGLAQLRFPQGHLISAGSGLVAADSPQAKEWETFGLIERETMYDLVGIAASDWIRFDIRTRTGRHAIGLSGQSTLRIGDRTYPIAGNFPLSADAVSQGRLILLRDDWKLDRFRRFRPLIYFVVVGGGEAYRRQFRLALASLDRFGGFDQSLLVITDADPDEIADMVPPGLLPHHAIMQVAHGDKIDGMLARLMLAEFPDAATYGPILYCDLDVMFDRPVMPLLERVALSGAFSAQSEPWNVLPHADHSGGPLFEADPTPIVHTHGFNSGIVAMPGGPETLEVLAVARRVASVYLEQNPRDSLPSLDQAILNYVLRRLEVFDPTVITQAVRLCHFADALDPASAAGLVHFWPTSDRADIRADRMERYLADLESVGAADR